MVKKASLPLLDVLPVRTPTIDVARRRLGGRATPSPLDGRAVRVGAVHGVVIAASDNEAHVLVAGDVVRRVPRAAAVSTDEGVDERLLCDVRVFVALGEGDRVRFVEREGTPAAEGVLFERCRFGALVAKDDGTIVAVGYRRLWPSSAASA